MPIFFQNNRSFLFLQCMFSFIFVSYFVLITFNFRFYLVSSAVPQKQLSNNNKVI